MKKGRDYERLQQGNLPVPDYGVFDEHCLIDAHGGQQLEKLVDRILSHGSGQIGLRTEPKAAHSPLGNYPHIMPLETIGEVRDAMQRVLRDHPEQSWWFLVNEAFTDYQWNAVVMLTDRLLVPGKPRLIGEVNEHDSLPLREAMSKTMNCIAVQHWQHSDRRWLYSRVSQSGILNEWLEASSVYSKGQVRKVFWGMR